jgi:hypothetical protein
VQRPQQGRPNEKSYREEARPAGPRPQTGTCRKEVGSEGTGQALSKRYLHFMRVA